MLSKGRGINENISIFFTYFSAPGVPALMKLLRASTGINDKKLFKVNVFKAAERKITLFVVCF